MIYAVDRISLIIPFPVSDSDMGRLERRGTGEPLVHPPRRTRGTARGRAEKTLHFRLPHDQTPGLPRTGRNPSEDVKIVPLRCAVEILSPGSMR